MIIPETEFGSNCKLGAVPSTIQGRKELRGVRPEEMGASERNQNSELMQFTSDTSAQTTLAAQQSFPR